MVMSSGLVLSAVSLWLQSGDWLYFREPESAGKAVSGMLSSSFLPSTLCDGAQFEHRMVSCVYVAFSFFVRGADL